jgi:hypothetical protein
MTYPIFNSIVNKIENELTQKGLTLKVFKTWHEDRINATGLEIMIDASEQNNYIKGISINFDWDRFREYNLARQLEGLAEHPMLQDKDLKSVTVSPKIDIELCWVFDEQKAQAIPPDAFYAEPPENAGEWMKALSREVNELLAEDDIITRWHFEIEGSIEHKHLSAISLISYFQYSLTELKSLNEVHAYVKKRVRELMVKSQKVRRLSDNTLQKVA